MLNLRKVAVTGGLSCGKSSVCRFFKEFGAYVVSADEIVHQLLTPMTSLGQQVIALLGDEIVKDGKIDRSFIAKKVFNNKNLLQSLEELVHPVVFSEIDKQYKIAKELKSISLFVAEIPLLFEVEGQHNFDTTIVVWSDTEDCKKRFESATGNNGKNYDLRMSYQMLPEEKIKLADYVIKNNGDLKDLQRQTKNLYSKLIT